MHETFGIEEEFILVDPHTLAPVPAASAAISALSSLVTVGAVTGEFLPCQIEYATDVCTTPSEAWQGIHTFRRLLSGWAHTVGVLAVPSGTPFQTLTEQPDITGERYQKIAGDVGGLTAEHLVNGMHVHVGISDLEEGIRVLNGLRGWLPLLVAISANSPFWSGHDTGHHSWRSIQTRRWTTYGVPPHLHSPEEYEQLRRRLTGIGATRDYCETSWSVRLSERFPTLEIRVCDTQLTAQHAVALAVLIRAVAHACARRSYRPPLVRAHVLDAELWHAARFGLTQGIYDPASDAHTSASEAVRSLRGLIAPQVSRQGVSRLVSATLREIVGGDTGAAQQRRAFLRGSRGLADLYRQSLTMRGAPGALSDPVPARGMPLPERVPRPDTDTAVSATGNAATPGAARRRVILPS